MEKNYSEKNTIYSICYVILGKTAKLCLETFGEITAGRETDSFRHFAAAHAFSQQAGGLVHSGRFQIVGGGDAGQGFDLSIETAATHVELLCQGVDAELFIRHVLIDKFLEVFHKLKVLLVHSKGLLFTADIAGVETVDAPHALIKLLAQT